MPRLFNLAGIIKKVSFILDMDLKYSFRAVRYFVNVSVARSEYSRYQYNKTKGINDTVFLSSPCMSSSCSLLIIGDIMLILGTDNEF